MAKKKFDLNGWMKGFVLGLSGKAFPTEPNDAPLAGWLMGRRVAGMRKKTIWYLYGKYKLPASPEWDRKTYPYAWIQAGGWPGYFATFIVSKTQPLWRENPNNSMIKVSCQKIDTVSWLVQYNPEDHKSINKFWQPDDYDYPDDYDWNTQSAGVVWANFDIVDDAGEIVLAASEPVPVYE